MHLFRSILNARFLRYVTLVFVAFLSFNVSVPTYSSLSPTTYTYAATRDTTNNPTETNVIKTLNSVVALISVIYVPFAMLSGWLLSPDWSFGEFIGLRPTLHALWIMMTNVVYVVFAAMLILVALANIFGQSDSYAIKKMLPRFVIAVIMVPFTWWVVSATLSVSSYMTGLVLRMPSDVITQNGNNNEVVIDYIPKVCTFDFQTEDTAKIWKCDKDPKNNFDKEDRKLSNYLLKGSNAYGIIPLYAYSIFSFQDLGEFEKKAESVTGGAGTLNNFKLIATAILKINIQLLMTVIYAIIFVIILIALVLVLFKRALHMWMYAIFSPLFALKYFLSDKVDKDSFLGKFDFKEFIGLAMVPVVVSAALGFGFLFVATFKAKFAKTDIQSEIVQVDNQSAGNSGSITIFGTKIEIKLPTDTSVCNTPTCAAPTAPELKNKINELLAGLIAPIFGLVILWMAVMAAIKTSAIAGKSIEGIEKFGSSIADMGKKLPGFLPVPGMTVKDKDDKEKPMNFKHLSAIQRSLSEIPGTMDSRAYSEVQRTWFNKEAVEDMTSAISAAATKQEALGIVMSKLATKNSNIDTLGNDENVKKAWKLVVTTKSGLDPTKQGEINALIDSGKLADALRKLGENKADWGVNKDAINNALIRITKQSSGDDLQKIATLAGVAVAKKFAMTHPPTINGPNITLNYTDGTAGDPQTIDWTAQSNKHEIETWLKGKFGDNAFKDSAALSAIAEHIHTQRPPGNPPPHP